MAELRSLNYTRDCIDCLFVSIKRRFKLWLLPFHTRLFIDAVSASTEENLKICRNKLVRIMVDVQLQENRGNKHELHLIFWAMS
jgi:hypothetical protein